jgi:hypothetical protein
MIRGWETQNSHDVSFTQDVTWIQPKVYQYFSNISVDIDKFISKYIWRGEGTSIIQKSYEKNDEENVYSIWSLIM